MKKKRKIKQIVYVKEPFNYIRFLFTGFFGGTILVNMIMGWGKWEALIIGVIFAFMFEEIMRYEEK